MSGVEFTYREVNSSRSISGDTFDQGVIDFNWSTGQPTSWIPSKSYFRVELEIRGTAGGGGAAGVQPETPERLAFADNAVSCLFNNVYMRAGGQDISSIVNYVPQAAQTKSRLQKSGAWLNSIGKDAYMLEASYAKRISNVSARPIPTLSDDYERVSLEAVGAPDCTLAVTAADGRVTGQRTVLDTAGLVNGDLLFIDGHVGRITTVAGDPVGAGMVITPFPTADIAATTNVYGLRKRNGGSRAKTFAIWQPPIGIFDHDKPMGAGDYRIQLNPNSDYKKACVESVRAGLAAPADFDVVVSKLTFYLATIKTSIPQGVETLYLMETMCQSKTVSSGSTQEFTVPSSTRGLAIFVQAQKAGTDVRVPPTSFKCLDESETTLQSLQITYANCTKPSTRWDSSFSPTNNGMLQRFIDTQIESGLINNPGGSESFKDWMARGALYYYSFDRDSQDKSTQVQVSVNYTGALDGVAPANLFVVAFYSRATEITTNNGSVVSVRTLNA